ncbi:hypothetical protein IWX90DRAFT_401594 [Phyllosticta citrichinensis]|uniref:RNB domain-containing protein n=1 Tax=Phyllosticta citrichinensis TaxID=1130410 RepID=A0ABR1XSD1_9PEZI
MPFVAIRAARKHPLARHHDLPSVCWSCLISRNARLAGTSSKASTKPPPERKSPDHPRTAIANYNAGQRVSLSSQIDGHRNRALEHQRSADARFTPANDSGSRSFHTTTAARQLQTTHGGKDHIKLRPDGLTSREFLAQWQKEHGVPNRDILDELGLQAYPGVSTGPGNLVKSGIPDKDEHQSNVNEEELDQPQDLAPPDEGVEHVLGAMHFTPGDLVEIAVGERDPVLGIVMRVYTNNAALVQTFTEEGKWGNVNQVKIQFAVPNFVPQSLVKPVLKYLPDKVVDAYEADVEFNHPINIPREESTPILDKLRDFSSKAHAIYRQNAARLENAHALLSHPTDLRFGSLQKITQTLLKTPKPSPAHLYAVRKGINHHQMSFLTDPRSHRLTGMYQIVSHEFKDSVMTAREWIREWQEYEAEKAVGQFDEAELKRRLPGAIHVQKYLEKARRLISESRKTRDPHLLSAGGSPGPSKIKREITPKTTAIEVVESEKFTKEDRVLIRYLEAYALSNTLSGSTQMQSTPPILLAASEMYPGRAFLDHTTAFCFLVETGVIPPYENRSKYDPHLLVPTAQYSKPLDAMYKWLSKPSRQNSIGDDSMHDLRKDWKDMTVFCVDSASAEEIDDGVSVESIPGSDDHWVHVHVANPTAFLKIDSGMAKMAAHMTESIYFPERTFSMLPKWAVDSGFSLGPNTNCLTISSRVGKDAAVKDIKIQNGFIRNVVSITPETMASLLSPDALSTKIFDVIVGGNVPPTRKRDMKSINDLTSRHVKELKTIHEIALGLLKKRQKGGGVSYNQSPPEVSVFNHYEQPGLPWILPSRDQARFYEGDPVIKMTVTPSESMFDHGNDAGFVIQELMLLAGESAAKWCSARDVPIIYRGTRDNPNNFTRDQLLEKFGDMQADPRPNASMVWAGNFMKSAGYSIVDTKIVPHKVLGLSGYTKCTSPLRRYGDMMVHWQIESALRKEAEGVDLMNKKDKQEFTFTKAYVASVLTRMSPRERLITKTKRLANMMWVSNVFQRGIHHGEWDCPRIFKGIVYNMSFRDSPTVGLVWPEFSLEVQMDMPIMNGIDDEVQIGDVWEVELRDVHMFSRRIETRPLRLIDRLTIPDDFPGDIRRKYN